MKRPARGRLLAALSFAVLWPAIETASPGPARGDGAPDPFARVAHGDAAGAVASLGDGYRRGALDIWQARLYQDLKLEAGERAALEKETGAAWPEPRAPMGQYLFARLADEKEIDAALQRVLPLLADPAPGLLDEAWAAVDSDHVARAAGLLPRLKKLAAGREEEALLEARILDAQGDRAAAERGLAAFVAGHRDAVDARRAWAATLLGLRRRADAKEVAEEALTRERTAPILVTRAAVALEFQDIETASKCLAEAAAGGRPSVQGEAAALRCAVRLLAKDEAGAEMAADAGLAACPGSPEALRAKARCLELLGKHQEALARIDAAIRARPNWGRLYVDKGVVLKALGQAKEAKKAFADARKRDPDDMEALLHLGVLDEEEGDWVGAEKNYRAILKAEPESVEAHRMLAGVLFSTGKLDPADAEAGWIRERLPKDPEAWAMSGRVAYRQDRFDDALSAFQKAIDADPTYAIAHMGRGWVLEAQDKKDDAKKAYEAGAAADPKFALVHRYLAELLDETNDATGALAHFKAYLDLGGEDPDEDVKHAIERLSK